MKRIFVVAALFLSIFSVAAVTAPTVLANQHCAKHGYSPAYCRVISSGRWIGFHVPSYGHKELELYVRSHLSSKVDVAIEDVSCPAGAPTSSVCFEVDFYNHATGQPIYSVGEPLSFKGKQVYGYDQQTGEFNKLRNNRSAKPGIFAFVP
ncbi:MAG TPA: hypothetical protein VG815_05680 [Chloroflexota bacterium]|jgi:hypothetical protein|nr:hypothetical protein [Chloroflexota bacterium]